MIVAYVFERLGVTVESIYFLEPDPDPGEEGPERGVRVELRVIQRHPRTGSMYSAYPVDIATAIWRADLLESVEAGPGSRDRMHFHPEMADDEPCDRVFDPAIRADPFDWLADKLEGIAAIVARKVDDPDSYGADIAEIVRNTPRIVESARDMLAQVHVGELALAPAQHGS